MNDVKNDAPICRTKEKHKEKIENAIKNLPDDEKIVGIAEFLSTFGDYTRVKILLALCNEELCPCDISSITKMSLSAVSHQLRVLRHKKLVKYRREGRNVYYSLQDDHVEKILKIALEHISEEK